MLNNKLNFLFVLPFLPYPMESGGHQALFNGIAAIKDYYNIYLIFSAYDDDNYKKNVKEFKKTIPQVHTIPFLHEVHHETFKEKIVRKLKSFFVKIQGKSEKTETDAFLFEKCNWWIGTVTPNNKEWLQLIYQTCIEQQIDIVQIEMPWRISDVLVIPDSIKKVYVHHELGFVRREMEMEKIGEDVYAKACQRFADLNEIALLNQYDEVITLSPIDAQKLKDVGVRTHVSSSFAIIDSLQDIEVDRGDGKRLTFVGPSTHNPNFVGVMWFLKNCWNLLKERCPDMQLDVIGQWSQQRIEAISAKYKDVHFLGFVDDLYGAIKDSTMIVPITIGSGIRMKILEASSKGVPFVTTSVGAEGIPVENGRECFIADTAEAFVKAVLKLQNPDVRKHHIVNANKMVREHYTLSTLSKNRLAIYEKL